MKAFVDLLIIMGVLKLPRLEMYWQVESDVLRTPGISSVNEQDTIRGDLAIFTLRATR